MIRNAIARLVAYVLYVVDFLLSFIPGTKANRAKLARAAIAARVASLEASCQKQYPGAKALHLSSVFGTRRSPQRSIRRVYAQMWPRAFHGWLLSARQWVRLRKAQKAGGVVRGHAAHVDYFLNGGDVKPSRARVA